MFAIGPFAELHNENYDEIYCVFVFGLELGRASKKGKEKKAPFVKVLKLFVLISILQITS